jgi:hypothetical protein
MTHETFGRFGTLPIFDFESKSAQKRLLKVSQIFWSKINLNHIADIVFDLRNEFHANRMKFGDFGERIFLRQF